MKAPAVAAKHGRVQHTDRVAGSNGGSGLLATAPNQHL